MSIKTFKKNDNTNNIFRILNNAGAKKASRSSRSESNIDFFMSSAMPSVMWMQESFKPEQR